MILSIDVVQGTEVIEFGRRLKATIDQLEKEKPGRFIELQYQATDKFYSCMIILRSRA